jgi:hypothetical protein
MMTNFLGRINKDTLWTSARIITNSALWASSQSNLRRKEIQENIANILVPIESQTKFLTPTLKYLKSEAIKISSKKNNKSVFWLRPELYNRSYGLTPFEMYEKIIDHIIYSCEEIEIKLSLIDNLIINLKEAMNDISIKKQGTSLEELTILTKLESNLKIVLLKYFEALSTQRPPLWLQTEPHFMGLYDLIKAARSSFDRAKEKESSYKESIIPDLSQQEMIDNPFSNLNLAAERLNDALKLLIIYESKMDKVISIWNLYNMH